MFSDTKRFFRTGSMLLGAGLVLAACESGTQSVAGPDAHRPSFAVDGAAEVGEFEVCKFYSGGVGPAVTIDFTVDFNGDGLGGPQDLAGSVVLGDGECAIVHTYDESNSNNGLQIQRVTVTEQVPAGYDPSYVLTSILLFGAPVVGPPTAGNSASADMLSQPDNGFLVEFTNTLIPRGNEGCTPGYWKQSHHFDSWTAPLAPGALFTAPGFTSPGSDARVKRGKTENNVSTQLQALQANQGGLAALTRHAMAALLNAASPDVAYAFTQAEIIQLYNDAVAGLIDVEATKDDFDAANNGAGGCPLN